MKSLQQAALAKVAGCSFLTTRFCDTKTLAADQNRWCRGVEAGSSIWLADWLAMIMMRCGDNRRFPQNRNGRLATYVPGVPRPQKRPPCEAPASTPSPPVSLPFNFALNKPPGQDESHSLITFPNWKFDFYFLAIMAESPLNVLLKGNTGRNTRGLLRIIILGTIAAAAVSSRLFSVIRMYHQLHWHRFNRYD